jgi:hypothetical protein
MNYAGIGSRQIPRSIKKDMQTFAHIAALKGWTLRSGGALGSDSAFETGCDKGQGRKEIFLPWPELNGNQSKYVMPTFASKQIAATIHPAYNKLGPAAKLLVARNMHQVLGPMLDDPVKFVICYTPDGCESASKYTQKTGGTGSAIALASKHFIPVFNIFTEQRFYDAVDFLANPNQEVFYEI